MSGRRAWIIDAEALFLLWSESTIGASEARSFGARVIWAGNLGKNSGFTVKKP